MAATTTRAKVKKLPRARVVRGVEGPSPVASHVRSAGRSMRPAARDAMAFMVGMWPLWMMMAFSLGLIWAFALGESP